MNPYVKDALVYTSINNNINNLDQINALVNSPSSQMVDVNNAANAVLSATTIKRACCMGRAGLDTNNPEHGIKVRIPIPKNYDITKDVNSTLQRYHGYIDQTVYVPPELCAAIPLYTPTSTSCDNFMELYCSNVKELYAKEKNIDITNRLAFDQASFAKYKPECACYGVWPSDEFETIVNPVCAMKGCKGVSPKVAYRNSDSVSATCPLNICINKVDVTQAQIAGGLDLADIKQDNNCGVNVKKTSDVVLPSGQTTPAQTTTDTTNQQTTTDTTNQQTTNQQTTTDKTTDKTTDTSPEEASKMIGYLGMGIVGLILLCLISMFALKGGWKATSLIPIVGIVVCGYFIMQYQNKKTVTEGLDPALKIVNSKLDSFIGTDKKVNFKTIIDNKTYYLASIPKSLCNGFVDNVIECKNNILVLIPEETITSELTQYLSDIKSTENACNIKLKTLCETTNPDNILSCDATYNDCNKRRSFIHDFSIIRNKNNMYHMLIIPDKNTEGKYQISHDTNNLNNKLVCSDVRFGSDTPQIYFDIINQNDKFRLKTSKNMFISRCNLQTCNYTGINISRICLSELGNANILDFDIVLI